MNNTYQIYLISDSTGETIDRIFLALKAQFQNFKYRPEKWTPKDILQHIIDNERITAYRALCLSRGESKKLMGYDENHYGMNSNANDRSMESLLEEFKLVRQSLILLFENFNKKMLFKTGICNERKDYASEITGERCSIITGASTRCVRTAKCEGCCGQHYRTKTKTWKCK